MYLHINLISLFFSSGYNGSENIPFDNFSVR